MEFINEKEFQIALGYNLRRIRKSKGFTQEQLANELDIEISQISRIERGLITTSIYNFHKISKCLKVSATDLLTF